MRKELVRGALTIGLALTGCSSNEPKEPSHSSANVLKVRGEISTDCTDPYNPVSTAMVTTGTESVFDLNIDGRKVTVNLDAEQLTAASEGSSEVRLTTKRKVPPSLVFQKGSTQDDLSIKHHQLVVQASCIPTGVKGSGFSIKN